MLGRIGPVNFSNWLLKQLASLAAIMKNGHGLVVLGQAARRRSVLEIDSRALVDAVSKSSSPVFVVNPFYS